MNISRYRHLLSALTEYLHPMLLSGCLVFAISACSATTGQIEYSQSTNSSKTEDRNKASVGSDISKVDVAFGGLALAGSVSISSASKQHDLAGYPHLSVLQNDLKRELHQRLRTIEPQHYRLHTDSLLNREHGYSVAMAMVIDDESVVVEKIDNMYKVITEISAKALVYDFDSEEKAIIAVYQIPIDSYAEIFDTRPSYAALHEMFKTRLLLADDSVLNRFIAKIKTAEIKQKYAQEVGIGRVVFSPRAMASLPSQWRADITSAEQMVGRRFASFLSSNQGVSVIPSTSDNSISTMALRFTGESLTTLLTFPQVDYLIDINVRAFAKKQIDQKSSGAAYLYAVGIGFAARESFDVSRDTIFQQKIKHSVGKTIHVSQTNIDDWDYYSEALYSGFDQFTSAISDRDSTWLQHQKFDRAGRQQLKSFNKMLNKCR